VFEKGPKQEAGGGGCVGRGVGPTRRRISTGPVIAAARRPFERIRGGLRNIAVYCQMSYSVCKSHNSLEPNPF